MRELPFRNSKKTIKVQKTIKFNNEDLVINTNAKVIKELLKDGTIQSFISQTKRSIKDNNDISISLKKKINLFLNVDLEMDEITFELIEILGLRKMIISKAIRTALIKSYRKELSEEFSEGISNNLMYVFEKGTIDDLINFSIWNDIELKTENDNFNSSYGYHTTVKKIAYFYYMDKNQEIEVYSDMQGTSWS